MRSKKFCSALLVYLSILFAFSCSQKSYEEYRVFTTPEKIRVLPGESSFITFNIEIPEKYHIYGNPKGPGIGKATEVIPEKHKYIIFEKARFLPAKKITAPGEKDFTWVHYNETKIFLPFNVRKNSLRGLYNIKIRFESLLCSETTCIPKNYTFEYPVEIINDSSDRTILSDKITALFKKASPPGGKSGSAVKDPATKPGKDKIEGKIGISRSSKPVEDLISRSFEPRFIQSSNVKGIIQAILFGIIAGFILNFMPCVLPVVSLKVMSFIKHAGKSGRELKKMGIFFTLGILFSFLILASLAAFFGYNWGDMFQSRAFLITLTAVIFVLALSMFKIYTINIPSFLGKAGGELKDHNADAFMKGFLATLLATPCSGPFLGGTLAWALTQRPLIIFIIFMSIGTGMAIPYLILTMKPDLIKFIPKPGPWMKTFEQAMGFLLLFTVIYLINILDKESIMPAVTFLAILAFAFWQYGIYGSLERKKSSRRLSAMVLLLLIAGGYFFSFKYLYINESVTLIRSKVFSMDELYKNGKAKRVTIVKFTADWCPNCKFVEKLALETERVFKVIEENNIDFMTADLTNKNPQARKLLIQLKSRSIPFLAVFPGGDSFTDPICLRDIYSEEDVLKAIDLALKKTDKKRVPEIKFNINNK